MQNFLLALQAVFPLAFMIVSGYAVSRTGALATDTCKQMNKVIFKYGMPFLIFANLYHADMSVMCDGQFLLLATGLVLGTVAIASVVVYRLVPEGKRRGVIIQGIYRTNFLIFAVPLVRSLYGEDAVALASILVCIIVPLYNFLAVVILERCRGGKLQPAKLFWQIISNPFIYSALLGMAFKWLDLHLYSGMVVAMDEIAGIVTPLTLFLLGADFKFTSAWANAKPLVLTVGARLLVVPAVALPLCLALGIRDMQLCILMAMTSTPTAVSSYTMALQMGGDGDLAGEIVVFSTICSLFTLVFWIFLLKQNGFM